MKTLEYRFDITHVHTLSLSVDLFAHGCRVRFIYDNQVNVSLNGGFSVR
jgi:hypothetical protein